MIVLLAFGLSLLLFLLVLLWILVPAFYGLPPVPTSPERIQTALQLAHLQPDETLYDLGAGDGRVLLAAARDFGAKAVGIEVGPIQCLLTWLRIRSSGFGDRVRIRWGNFYSVDLREADVVFVYATSKEVRKLAPLLESRMKSGARLVSIAADFEEWEPAVVDEQNLIFLYEMPPQKGSLTTYLLKKEI